MTSEGGLPQAAGLRPCCGQALTSWLSTVIAMDPTTTTLDWPQQLMNQLAWYWEGQLRPRLEGLSDEEYHWEPSPGTWGVRRRGTSSAPMAVGSGGWTCDFAVPEPVPAPVTTIAWRLAHLVVGIFGARNASHFGGPPVDYPGFAYAGTADEALTQLDAGYAAWTTGVASLGPEGMADLAGPAEGPSADRPMAELVLHITREVVHHGAEVALLRDLWAQRG